MLRQMPYPSPMDAKTNPVRIFQERTNFKNVQAYDRLDLCIEESLTQAAFSTSPHRSDLLVRSITKSGSLQQENSFILPRRRKSERKMLRSQVVPPESNVWPVPIDAALPTHEHSPAMEEEPLHGHIEPLQGPISHQPWPYSQPSQRVRADASLLLINSSETESELDHKLKVAALTRVTSSLAAKASDAKAGVNRLRTLLADRAVDPRIYEATQRERWMEERRQIATEELLKTIQNHLSSLVKSPVSQSSPAAEAEINHVSSTAVNLHTFLSSPQRHATRSRRRRPYPAPLPEEAFNRIRHHKQLLPLRLKVPVHRPFSQPPPKAKEAVTTGMQNPLPTTVADAPTESTVTTATSPTSSSNALLNPLPSPTPLLDVIPENQEVALIPSLERPPSPGNGNGMATIWRASPLRSKEEILAGIDMGTDTDIPDYFQGLLAEMDSTAVARVRLNSLRRPASFPRRVAFPTPAPRTPKRTSHANSNAGVKRSTVVSTPDAPSLPAQPFNMPSPAPMHTNTSANASPHLHSSPSRRRLSALFSLPEVLSSRRSLNNPSTTDATFPLTTSSSSATQLPAMSLVSPSIQFTIMESSREAEEEAEAENGHVDVDVDVALEKAEQSKDGAPEQHPVVAPIPPSASAVTLSSLGTTRDARRSSVGVNSSSTEEKMLARLRRRMSAALGRQ